MTKPPTFPPAVLEQHVAALGKTGSGKTSTAKLLVEQAVAEGARVCVLDPIKSDWWGLTSSANGKQAGLPFHILGGPHGHVPLHAGAGKAVGEIVASGALRLSILDMADFGPKELHPFFVDFASTLFRSVKGVVYLVMEEAHLFAPKERLGDENFSIYWFKRMATGARSKGIRLVLCTQRPAELHNTVLASCDTIIAHRITFPDDQERVTKWFSGHLDKKAAADVASNLGGLQKGEAYLCAHEAGIFERRTFPRIATYDNTATPTGDGADQRVKTAPVDQDTLRTLIGEAVEEAKANDPKELKRQLAELRVTNTKLQRDVEQAANRSIADTSTAQHSVEVKAELQRAARELATLRSALEDAMKFIVKVNAQNFSTDGVIDETALQAAVSGAVQKVAKEVKAKVDAQVDEFNRLKTAAGRLQEQIATLLNSKVEIAVTVQKQEPYKVVAPPREPRRPPATGPSGDASVGNSGLRRMLIALAQRSGGLTRAQLGIRSGLSPRTGTFATYLGRMRSQGWVSNVGDRIQITGAGVAALGSYDPLPEGPDLAAYWINELGGGAARMLQAIVAAHPRVLSREELGRAADLSPATGTFATYLGKLRGLELVASRGELVASEELFG